MGIDTGRPAPASRHSELRDVTRRRTRLTVQRGMEVQRVEKALEDTGLKITSVVGDITGVSGRRILGRLIEGQRDPVALTAGLHGNLKATRAELVEAATGFFTDHHAYLITTHLQVIDFLDAQIAGLDRRIDEMITAMPPESTTPPAPGTGNGPGPGEHSGTEGGQGAVRRLTTIPGVNLRAAQIIVSEAGFTLHTFPTAGHFASWLGLVGGRNESAGVKRRAAPGKGNSALRRVLGTAAMSAASHAGTYYHARYQRLRTRMDGRKALVAIMHDIAEAIWHILAEGQLFRELGPDYFTRTEPAKVQARITKLAASIGMTAHLTDIAAPG